MRDWLWSPEEVKDTPSVRAGMSHANEAKLRREGIRLIMEVGTGVRAKAWPTIGTAAVYFHRFYMFHTFQEFAREMTAMGCLFLAGKVSETPKKCKDIVTAAQNVFPTVYGQKNRNAFVDEIMGIERVLLQTMKFDLQVDLPYQYLIDYSKKFKLTKTEINSLVHTSWTFVNDSSFTVLCLIWEPQVIAVALLHLSITVRKVNIGLPDCWWNEYIANLSNSLIDDICHKVLDFYSISKEEKMDFMPPRPFVLGQTPIMPAPAAAKSVCLAVSKLLFCDM
ncbi:hypothetical protein RB195_015327 [Necator americanus]|uniref:Cyclin-like domain-containing protein n=1 Tax=Necator americanus TaxID=51031 RepID=A0ABR1E411_NECAM